MLLSRAIRVQLAVVEVVVEVVARAAGLVDRFPVRFPNLPEVVARDGVGERLAAVSRDAVARALRAARLEQRVVEEIAPPAAPFARRARLRERPAVVRVRRALGELAAAVVHVPENVQRPMVRHRARHAGGR